MKIFELRKDSIISDWLGTINPSKNTERNYLIAIKIFCEFTGKKPEELIEEAEKEMQEGLLVRKRSIKGYFIDFHSFLKDEKKLAPMTIKGYMVGIRSFYIRNDIEVPKLAREGKVKPLEKHTEIPNKEDLQDVLKICDPIEKAILLVGASSGLSANEIINLKIKDFNKGYDPKTEITILKLRREKVQFNFITFLSPEASRAVQDYINYRGRAAKIERESRQKQLSKQKVTSDNGFLFIKQHIHDTYLETRDENERKLDRDTLMKIYRGMSEKAQKNTPKMDWNLIRSHNIRKYFNSAMLNAGADSFFVEYCMGHTLDDTRAAYFRASPEKLKEIYLKYVPYLTIQKEIDIEKHPDFIKIKEDRDTFARAAAVAQVENYQLKELKSEFENRNSELELLKAEVEKLKKASIEKTEEEALFSDIVAGEFSYLNRGPTFDEDYNRHSERMDKDPEYFKRFLEFEKAFLFETFKAHEFEKEYKEHKEKEKLEQKKIERIDSKITNIVSKLANANKQ